MSLWTALIPGWKPRTTRIPFGEKWGTTKVNNNLFGFRVGTFLRNWVVFLVVALLTAVSVLGFNSVTQDFDLVDGFNELSALFGGTASFMALLGIALGAVILAALINHVALTDYTEHNGTRYLHIGIGLAIGVLLLVAGKLCVDLPEDWGTAALVLVAIFAALTIATAIVTPRVRAVAAVPAPPADAAPAADAPAADAAPAAPAIDPAA